MLAPCNEKRTKKIQETADLNVPHTPCSPCVSSRRTGKPSRQNVKDLKVTEREGEHSVKDAQGVMKGKDIEFSKIC